MYLRILIPLFFVSQSLTLSASLQENCENRLAGLSKRKIFIQMPSEIYKYTENELQTSQLCFSIAAQDNTDCMVKVLKTCPTVTCNFSVIKKIWLSNKNQHFKTVDLKIRLQKNELKQLLSPESLEMLSMFPDIKILKIAQTLMMGLPSPLEKEISDRLKACGNLKDIKTSLNISHLGEIFIQPVKNIAKISHDN